MSQVDRPTNADDSNFNIMDQMWKIYQQDLMKVLGNLKTLILHTETTLLLLWCIVYGYFVYRDRESLFMIALRYTMVWLLLPILFMTIVSLAFLQRRWDTKKILEILSTHEDKIWYHTLIKKMLESWINIPPKIRPQMMKCYNEGEVAYLKPDKKSQYLPHGTNLTNTIWSPVSHFIRPGVRLTDESITANKYFLLKNIFTRIARDIPKEQAKQLNQIRSIVSNSIRMDTTKKRVTKEITRNWRTEIFYSSDIKWVTDNQQFVSEFYTNPVFQKIVEKIMSKEQFEDLLLLLATILWGNLYTQLTLEGYSNKNFKKRAFGVVKKQGDIS